MQPEVLIQSLKMKVDPADSSYMPSLVVVSAGPSYSSLQPLATVYIRNNDIIVPLLTDVKEVIFFLNYYKYLGSLFLRVPIPLNLAQ
jgi:E3 ubiquitin-protein ligase HERC2